MDLRLVGSEKVRLLLRSFSRILLTVLHCSQVPR